MSTNNLWSDERFPKVVLHLHLEGAIRPATVWDLAKKRGIPVKAETLEELYEHLTGWESGDLRTFLSQFQTFMPTVAGCLETVERISYELCQDAAKEGVVYFEARYAPHLMANTPGLKAYFPRADGDITPRDVVQAVNEGIRRGSRDFGVIGRTILCMLRETPEWSSEILELCKEFHNDTVVGIDLANDESRELYPEHVEAFKGALDHGIHRTCHAGESGPACNVRTAIEVMKAERIGHGYHIIDDESVMKLVKDKSVHLEVCPSSSLRTGAVTTTLDQHCAKRFLQEGLDLSINTDDPTLFDTTMIREFGICRKHFGMDDKALANMTLNAAKACFLPEDEKHRLVNQLEDKFKQFLEK